MRRFARTWLVALGLVGVTAALGVRVDLVVWLNRWMLTLLIAAVVVIPLQIRRLDTRDAGSLAGGIAATIGFLLVAVVVAVPIAGLTFSLAWREGESVAHSGVHLVWVWGAYTLSLWISFMVLRRTRRSTDRKKPQSTLLEKPSNPWEY